MEPEARTVAQMLEELHVTMTFGVETGKISSSGYFARSGAAQLAITRDQMNALRRDGAPANNVEVIRSFKNDRNVTFSDHCPGCQRWIHLGGAEREGECFCGQTYRVAFDLTPDNWSLRQDMRCMDCGVEVTMSLAGPDLNPWHAINGYQVQCDACAKKRLDHQASTSTPRTSLR